MRRLRRLGFGGDFFRRAGKPNSTAGKDAYRYDLGAVYFPMESLIFWTKLLASSSLKLPVTLALPPVIGV